jgi:opacity protein-like surface antigen
MKKILLLAILAFAGTSLLAQSNFSITYSIGFPSGDLKDFISKTSFRGIAVDYRYNFAPDKALGFNAGFNTFYEELPTDTYTIDNFSLTGRQYRYSNNIPMLATATYYFVPHDFIKPYATLGIGTMYSRRNTDMNLYTFEQEAWNFTLQPEIGVKFETAEHIEIVLSGKYLHGFAAGSELKEAQSYFCLNVGVCFF